MSVLEVAGARPFFTDSGPAADRTGTPILLVHGWTCDSHDWLFQFEAFEARHRVIAVDLRGHGRSSSGPDYTVQSYARDLTALLEHLRVEPVVAIGHSLGGSVVAALAIEHSDRVCGTVCVEPAYGQSRAAIEWLRDVATQFGDMAGNVIAAQLLGATEPLVPAWLAHWHRRRTIGMEPAVLRDTFHDLYLCDTQVSGQPYSDAYLARRTCPTLAFHRVPEMADWERGVLTTPHSKVVSWEGSGHWLHQERPVEFNAIVLAWLQQMPWESPDRSRGTGDGATV